MSYCEEYWQLLNARLDGELSPDDAARLEQHLAQCPHCRQSAEDLDVLQAAMRDLPVVTAPAGFKDKVMAAVAADNVIPLAPAKRPWKKYLSTAAVLALIVGAGILYRLPAGAPGDDKGAVPASTPISTLSAETAGVGATPKNSARATDEVSQSAIVTGDAAENTSTVFTSGQLPTEDAPAQVETADLSMESAKQKDAAPTGATARPESASASASNSESLPAATFRALSVPTEGTDETGAAASISAPMVTAGAIPSPRGSTTDDTLETATEDASGEEWDEEIMYDQASPVETTPGFGSSAKKESITSRQALELVVDYVNAAQPLTNVYTEDESVLSCTNSLPDTNAVVNTVVYEGLTQDGAYYLFSVETPDCAADRYQVSLDGSQIQNTTP